MEGLALSIKGLVKNYGRVQALRGVDLEVNRGEVFGFLGPNGAGKTTTIRCLLGLIRPHSGTMRVLGLDAAVDSVAVRARVGYLPGELNLEDNLPVADALRYFKSLRGDRVDWGFVRQLAERLQLDLNTPIRNLSKGNKQKVGIVQALMSRPELLLLDEPTSGLDPLMQREVYRLLKEAQAGGATVFFSSHVISEVEAIAERVAIIRQGIIVEEAEPARLIDMSVRRVRVRFKWPVDTTALSRVPGVSAVSPAEASSVPLTLTLRVEGEMDGLIKALATLPVRDIETEHSSLEDIFLQYYETGVRRVS